MNFDEFGYSVKYLNILKEKKQKENKRKRFDDLHLRNQRKLLRNSGQEYVSVSNKIVDAKKFIHVTSCCQKNCYEKVSKNDQKHLFEYFWCLSNYNEQNVLIYGLLDKKLIKWNYNLDILGRKELVCKEFFMKISQITKNRINTIQSKILKGISLHDSRGKHNNHNNIDSQTWDFLNEFINRIPKNSSHYQLEKSQRLYFDDSSLTLKKLHEEFLKILSDNNKNKICNRSFVDYFNSNFNIGFSNPKSDVCDLCSEMTEIGQSNLTPEQKAIFKKHLQDVETYKNLKDKILKEELNVKLVIEFDYSQNKPLPKLSNTTNYYKRCLWFFTFNIFIYNNNKSYMIHFIEGENKKGANSVSSFLFEILKQINLSSFKEVILFSDSCPAQNKNSTLFKCLIYLSNLFKIQISHVYAVKGHSYCVCDRQFALFTKKVKKMDQDSAINVQ